MTPVEQLVRHPWAAVVAWLTMLAFVVTNAFAIAGIRAATNERARLSCEGARDTRQLLVGVVDELADILENQEAAQAFRKAAVADMRQPPFQCVDLTEPPLDE